MLRVNIISNDLVTVKSFELRDTQQNITKWCCSYKVCVKTAETFPCIALNHLGRGLLKSALRLFVLQEMSIDPAASSPDLLQPKEEPVYSSSVLVPDVLAHSGKLPINNSLELSSPFLFPSGPSFIAILDLNSGHDLIARLCSMFVNSNWTWTKSNDVKSNYNNL